METKEQLRKKLLAAQKKVEKLKKEKTTLSRTLRSREDESRRLKQDKESLLKYFRRYSQELIDTIKDHTSFGKTCLYVAEHRGIGWTESVRKVAEQTQIILITDNRNYFKDRFPKNTIMLTPEEAKRGELGRKPHIPIFIDNQCYTNGAGEIQSLITDKFIKEGRDLLRSMVGP